MKKLILGNSATTSIVGYIIAALMAFVEIQKSGETNWTNIIIGVALAVLGRVSADAKKSDKSDVVGDGTRPPKGNG
jgi:hypothetical protein